MSLYVLFEFKVKGSKALCLVREVVQDMMLWKAGFPVPSTQPVMPGIDES